MNPKFVYINDGYIYVTPEQNTADLKAYAKEHELKILELKFVGTMKYEYGRVYYEPSTKVLAILGDDDILLTFEIGKIRFFKEIDSDDVVVFTTSETVAMLLEFLGDWEEVSGVDDTVVPRYIDDAEMEDMLRDYEYDVIAYHYDEVYLLDRETGYIILVRPEETSTWIPK